ncbi:Exosortase F system-associated protein [Flavobacterium sp. 9AF]|uniref:exosortase F system-associated membrane protein n=1 Tax=Flavobacterium sp. 9AF TaxID=2653142 RepID=UPI0012F0530B|nr:exosortase F system-associated protein [Flavobacterium sp. 9AF]VXB07274.1 Exosortase F system-associated protein [Flavobacterium sp. 9AF]
MARIKVRYFYILIFIISLILIRFFESHLFYDPFLAFFKSEYQNKSLPIYNGWKLFLGISFRYFINTVISLGLIYFLFLEKKMIAFAVGLYCILFTILISLFFILLQDEKPNYLILFYTRRFLIQPLFLLLFIPAFYYQKMIKK